VRAQKAQLTVPWGRRDTPVVSASATAPPPSAGARIRVDGKFFACAAERFPFRGVTYGTFRRREDGALFPDSATIASDFEQIAAAGFTVVRTYTPPSPDLLDHAASAGLRVMAGAFFEDWRYSLGRSRREWRQMAHTARAHVRRTARALAGNPAVAALVVGNEVPADVVRWVGPRAVGRLLGELVEVARDQDPELLLTYGNYPSTEYLDLPNLDFVTFNVFLEREADFRSYLARLHNLAGDRPVVLGEIGLDAGQGEQAQAEALDWQLRAALERGIAGTCVFSWTDEWWVADQRVEGWRFGLTDPGRRPRPALAVAARWNRRHLADLMARWPSITAVVCARNAQATLGECVRRLCALDYPDLEVLVVDDGSTDRTAAIALEHGATVLALPPSGLASARNAGARAARGEIVAFIDSDAFPPAEWPYLLALGFDGPTVAGVGGPNLPPRDDRLVARAVARAPGGPLHVLLSDDRAEHVPGCNMAFWRDVIIELDGFDPVFTEAGDDVDFCWRALDAGWVIGFHAGAFVWHRRRATVRDYLRQQRGYGRAEALVQARHPERFTPIGTARWRGSIYGSLARRLLRPRVYHGQYGTAAYQSVYRGTGHGLDIAHQLGIPAAAAAVLTAPAAAISWIWALPAVVGVLWAITLVTLDFLALGWVDGRKDIRVRLLATALHLLQPFPRLWGLLAQSARFRRAARNGLTLPGPARELPRGVLLLPLRQSRTELVPRIAACLAAAGLRVSLAGPWADHDALVSGSTLVAGRLVTSAHPDGAVQVRIDPRLRRVRLLGLLIAIGILAFTAPVVAGAVAAAVSTDACLGLWRVGPGGRRALRRAARADG
jgi:glycosyltransferase involved in cell wall biosynthesis